MIDLGVYIVETITRPYHTEAGAADMLSIKLNCNAKISETRTKPAHTEASVTDIISFKVAYNPPGNMVVDIDGSRGPWG